MHAHDCIVTHCKKWWLTLSTADSKPLDKSHQPRSFDYPKGTFGKKNTEKRALRAVGFERWSWLHYRRNWTSSKLLLTPLLRTHAHTHNTHSLHTHIHTHYTLTYYTHTHNKHTCLVCPLPFRSCGPPPKRKQDWGLDPVDYSLLVPYI